MLSGDGCLCAQGSLLPMVPTPTAQWNEAEHSNVSASACPTPSAADQPRKPAALLGAASRAPCTIVWHVYLGNATEGSGELLEDDGRSTAYQRGEIARTVANYSLDGPAMLVRIGAQAGNYSGSPAARWVDVVVHNVLAPISAKLLFPASGESIMGAVSWDARSLSATVRLGVVEAAKGASVQLLWAASPLSALLCRQDRTVRAPLRRCRCLLWLLTVSRRLAQGWPRLNARVMDIKRAIECAHPLPTPVCIIYTR